MECKVGTIRDIHKRLNNEGYRISEHALRMWIKRGDLPAVYSGTKALIAYANVLELLGTKAGAVTSSLAH